MELIVATNAKKYHIDTSFSFHNFLSSFSQSVLLGKSKDQIIQEIN